MKTAKLFMNGKSQAVRLPKEFRFEGSEVYIKKMGRGVMLIPKNGTEDQWAAIWRAQQLVTPDFMDDYTSPQESGREEVSFD